MPITFFLLGDNPLLYLYTHDWLTSLVDPFVVQVIAAVPVIERVVLAGFIPAGQNEL